MKCELCHKADAQTAITREKDGEEEELYVCNVCAKAERQRRQRMCQRTRKFKGPGMEMSVTEIRPVDENGESDLGEGEGIEPPPFLGAIMNAFSDMVTELEKVGKTAKGRAETKRDELVEFPLSRAPAEYRIGSMLQLEGLFLIGELEAVKRGLRALGMEIRGIDADGVHDAGHCFKLYHPGDTERAKRVVSDLLREEKNARVRLFEEMKRVFGDSLCRALAILKNCRLLSPGEFFDILSPLRLASKEEMLDGITLKEIERYLAGIDLSSREDGLEPAERDRVDGERADEMNERFMNVMLNERAEEKFL